MRTPGEQVDQLELPAAGAAAEVSELEELEELLLSEALELLRESVR
ncbi:hypothetical protein [Nesterenkonia sp.]